MYMIEHCILDFDIHRTYSLVAIRRMLASRYAVTAVAKGMNLEMCLAAWCLDYPWFAKGPWSDDRRIGTGPLSID